MAKQYAKVLKERAVRLVLATRDQHKTESAAIRSIGEARHRAGAPWNWARRAEVDAGARTGTTAEGSAQLKALKKEVAELNRANPGTSRSVRPWLPPVPPYQSNELHRWKPQLVSRHPTAVHPESSPPEAPALSRFSMSTEMAPPTDNRPKGPTGHRYEERALHSLRDHNGGERQHNGGERLG